MSNQCYCTCTKTNTTPKSLFGCEKCTKQVVRRNGLQDDICWSYYGPLPDCCCQTCRRQMELLMRRRKCINFRDMYAPFPKHLQSSATSYPFAMPCNICQQRPESDFPPCPVCCPACMPCNFPQEFYSDIHKSENEVVTESKSVGDLSSTIDSTTVSTSSDDLHIRGEGETGTEDTPLEDKLEDFPRGTCQKCFVKSFLSNLSDVKVCKCTKSASVLLLSKKENPNMTNCKTNLAADYQKSIYPKCKRCVPFYNRWISYKRDVCRFYNRMAYYRQYVYTSRPMYDHYLCTWSRTPYYQGIYNTSFIKKSKPPKRKKNSGTKNIEVSVQTDNVCFCKTKSEVQLPCSKILVKKPSKILPVMEVDLTFKCKKFRRSSTSIHLNNTNICEDISAKKLCSQCILSVESSSKISCVGKNLNISDNSTSCTCGSEKSLNKSNTNISAKKICSQCLLSIESSSKISCVCKSSHEDLNISDNLIPCTGDGKKSLNKSNTKNSAKKVCSQCLLSIESSSKISCVCKSSHESNKKISVGESPSFPLNGTFESKTNYIFEVYKPRCANFKSNSAWKPITLFPLKDDKKVKTELGRVGLNKDEEQHLDKIDCETLPSCSYKKFDLSERSSPVYKIVIDFKNGNQKSITSEISNPYKNDSADILPFPEISLDSSNSNEDCDCETSQSFESLK